METRDILNAQGVKIGTLTYPIGTPEAFWQKMLALYSTPITMPIQDVVNLKVKKMFQFNEYLKQQMIAENILLGISQIPNGRNLCDIAFDPAYEQMRKCKYPEALAALATLKADNSQMLDPIITPARVQKYYDQIMEFISNL